ncbi:MAG TPA: VanW family protein [Armatimonadota bacterium]|nr:VanW family protein [Armatimonadota bacterium]
MEPLGAKHHDMAPADGAPRVVRRARRPRGLAILVTVLLVTGIGLAGMTADRGQIYPNIFVAGAAVGGLRDEDKLNDKIFNAVTPPAKIPATVVVADRRFTCTVADTGVSPNIQGAVQQAYAIGRTGSPLRQFAARIHAQWRRTDIAVPMEADPEQVALFAAQCAKRFDRAAVSAQTELDGHAVRVTPGRPGVVVETGQALEAIRDWAREGCRGPLRLPAHFVGPAVTADKFNGIDTVLVTVVTTVAGSSRNRRHNIALAAAAVDGYLLAPGAVFSYDEVVGPRTENQGYRTAPVIVAGKLVPGTGGGACQVSSTLYQVALRAGLATVKRSHHSHPVPYTPAGLDATVVQGVMDLKFRNSLQHPVVLWARVEGGRLICRALGHGPPPRVELVRRVQQVEPPAARTIEDSTLAVGERKIEIPARPGLRVRLIRTITGDGGNVTDVTSSYYAAQRGVIRAGPSAPEQPPAPAASAAPGNAPEVNADGDRGGTQAEPPRSLANAGGDRKIRA